MKILYAIQGTGNGHLCRARDIIPALLERAQVDILISGTQGDIEIPYPIKYNLKGLSFIFGKKGGVDLWQTFAQNKLRSLGKEIRQLPIEQYDLVINDFEPVSAWAALLSGTPCFSLSHQAAVLHELAPIPVKKDYLGRLILKRYAPSKFQFGYHFTAINDTIFTPLIRKQVRELTISTQQHYTVYLPAYSDEKLLAIFQNFEEIQWNVFSKHNKKAKKLGNVFIQPINNELFLSSLASCKGIICGAGFETPAEALFLKKKLMVIPMKNQYEQHCNAEALKRLGVPVLKNFKKSQLGKIKEWIDTDKIIEVEFPDKTDEIIDLVLSTYDELYNTNNLLPETLETI